MRTQFHLWRAIDNPQDKAHGRLQSTDPLLVSRALNDLLNGRPISFDGPHGQAVSLDREQQRVLCDASPAPRRRADGPEAINRHLNSGTGKQCQKPE